MIALSPTPVLETERLRLRAPQGDDWPHWRAFHESERATMVGGGTNQPAGQSWRAFGHVIGHWAMRGFGMFVFTRKDDPTPLTLPTSCDSSPLDPGQRWRCASSPA